MKEPGRGMEPPNGWQGGGGDYSTIKTRGQVPGRMGPDPQQESITSHRRGLRQDRPLRLAATTRTTDVIPTRANWSAGPQYLRGKEEGLPERRESLLTLIVRCSVEGSVCL